MTNLTQTVNQPLVYNGSEIRAKNEMLSLTDMWKAQGSPGNKRPDDWKKDSGHREFMEHVAMMLNTPTKGIWWRRLSRT